MSHKLVILASGQGSTFEAIVNACNNKEINATVELLVCNKGTAQVLERAKKLAIEATVIPFIDSSQENDFAQDLIRQLEPIQPDLIILAGFLKKLSPAVIEKYSHKILNTHPSLLPKFGGAGMYGRKVHEAVINARETHSGISVHLVTDNYDEGPILNQKSIALSPDETIESLERKVKDQEPAFYIETIKKYLLEK